MAINYLLKNSFFNIKKHIKNSCALINVFIFRVYMYDVGSCCSVISKIMLLY